MTPNQNDEVTRVEYTFSINVPEMSPQRYEEIELTADIWGHSDTLECLEEIDRLKAKLVTFDERHSELQAAFDSLFRNYEDLRAVFEASFDIYPVATRGDL